MAKIPLLTYLENFNWVVIRAPLLLWEKISLKFSTVLKFEKMSDSCSKHYTLEQRVFIVEYYFRSNSYQTILQLHKKYFYDTPDIRTMKLTIEWFQTDYTLADAPRWRRPHAYSDNYGTKITEHTGKNPGMSVCRIFQKLDHKHETACTTL